jgi:MHS family proline/betaine transporter-like MFS transporter
VLESAPAGRRARWIGIVYSASFVPTAVVALLILALQAGMGEAAYLAWGWRIPFVLGAVIAVVGLWLRIRLSDPEEYTEAAREEKVENPVRSAATRQLRSVIIVILLVAPQTVAVYLLITYMYSYLVQTVGLSSTSALLSNAVATIVVTLLVPLLGALADRIGRKIVMAIGASWLLVMAYPAIWLVARGGVAGAYAGQLLLAVGISFFVAGCIVTMLELFRTSVRYSGHALSYNLGTALFGGTTPFVAGLLVSAVGPLAPAYYLAAAALFGLIVVVWFTPETRDVRLRTSISGEAVEPVRPDVVADGSDPVSAR